MSESVDIGRPATAAYAGVGNLMQDALVRLLVVLLAIAALPLVTPMLPEGARVIYGRDLVNFPFLLIALVLLKARADRSPDLTGRWFWKLVWIGMLGWLAASIIDPFADTLLEFSPVLHDILRHAPYLVLYAGVLLALELHPFTVRDSVPQNLRMLGWTSSFVLVFSLLVYFLLLPEMLVGGTARAWTYSQVLFVALDTYIIIRLWHLYHLAATPAWRRSYAWLLASVVIWLAGDLFYALMGHDVLPDPGWGNVYDMIWPISLVALAIATRPEAELPRQVHQVTRPYQPLGMGPMTIIVVFPLLLHVTYYHFETTEENMRALRDGLVLLTTGLLTGMALVYHRLLRIENRRLLQQEIEARQLLQYRAFHDELTGLPNRSLFRDRLKVAIAEATRQGTRCSVLFCDLDNFKVINDSLGHEAGDQMLVSASQRLRDAVRGQDTVARLGGDEFAVILQGTRGGLEGATLAKKLLSTLSEPVQLEGKTHVLNASIGIAVFPDDGEDEDTLLKHADTAMYQAKLQGRNNYRLFTQAMNDAAEERLAIEQGLRSGLLEERFVVFYQPIVDLASGRIISHEALLRWNHPERGFVRPVSFIDVAEQSGLIVELGQWVLESACAWAAGKGGDTPLSVNISQRQLRNADFADSVRQALARSGLPPHRLQLEITESMALTSRYTAQVLAELRELGIRIAIDDFGTGYAALSRLEQLPVDILKIDRSFVSGLSEDSVSEAIILAIVNMAKALGFSVIAEGVETEGELALVRKLGCDAAQGYLLCEPRSPSELPTRIDNWPG